MSIQTNKLPDNPEIEVVKAGKTGLFTNYIFKAIPLVFDESMSYYETLCGLLNYLKNTIIPTVNNNADAVAELQTLYEELRTFVDNYFTNLDVQEEINNKLDAMVKDGTITMLIKQYIDPLYQAYENDINNIINDQNLKIKNVENQVKSAVSGTPLIASSTSEMTDTTRMYVNTNDGYVYYYSNNQWVKGWLYQSSQNNDIVTMLKNDIYEKSLETFNYEIGTINSNNGTNGSNTERIRINDFIDIEKYRILKINQNYDLNIFAYSNNNVDSYLGTTSWINEKEYYLNDILNDFPLTKYVRFIFRSNPEREMTTQDITNSNISLYDIQYATIEELNETNEKIDEQTTIDGEDLTCSFIQGSISSNNGRIDTSRNDRIVDTNFYKSSEIDNITCDNGYKILIANYQNANEDNFINVSNWLSSPITNFTANYIRIVVKKDNEGTITPSETTNTIIHTKGKSLKTYVQEIDNSLNKIINSSNCPNIIWQSRNITDDMCPPFSKDYVKLSVENEFDRILVYVRKTTDGKYVSIHEDTINYEARNLDGSIISQPISSNGQSLETLNSYDWGIKYGTKYKGMHVPMVDDVMKWASQYNIALTVHFSYGFNQEDAENIFNMACKYGLIDNLIVLSSGGLQFERLNYFKDLNDNISYYFGCTYDDLITNINSIKSFITNKNSVYVQPMPWGTITDDAYIQYARKNNLKLYNSTVMNKNDLFNVVGFDKGYSIIETANVENIKSTVRNYINSI